MNDHRTIASTPTRNNAGLIFDKAVARAGEAWRSAAIKYQRK
jgi:hypothetical protein